MKLGDCLESSNKQKDIDFQLTDFFFGAVFFFLGAAFFFGADFFFLGAVFFLGAAFFFGAAALAAFFLKSALQNNTII